MEKFFKSILDADSTIDTSIDLNIALIVLISAFAVGIVVSAAYMIASGKRGAFSQNFMLTLVALPPIVGLIILVVGSSIAGAFSLAGAFMNSLTLSRAPS